MWCRWSHHIEAVVEAGEGIPHRAIDNGGCGSIRVPWAIKAFGGAAARARIRRVAETWYIVGGLAVNKGRVYVTRVLCGNIKEIHDNDKRGRANGFWREGRSVDGQT